MFSKQPTFLFGPNPITIMSVIAQRAMSTLLEQHAFEGYSGQWVVAKNKIQTFFSEFGVAKHVAQQIFRLTPDIEAEVSGVISVNALRLACNQILKLPIRLPTLVIQDEQEERSQPGHGQASAIPLCDEPTSPTSQTASGVVVPFWERLFQSDRDLGGSQSAGLLAASPSPASAVLGPMMTDSFTDVETQSQSSLQVDASSGSRNDRTWKPWRPGDPLNLVQALPAAGHAQRLSVSKTYTQDELMQREKHDLVKHVLNLQKQSSRKLATVKSLRNFGERKDRALKKSSSKLALATQNSHAEVDQCFTVRKRGLGLDGRGGRLSLSSIFSIGLRRSCTSIAAGDFGIVSMVEVSAQTVLRCELRTAAAICQSMRVFVSSALDLCFDHHRGGQWSLVAIGVRADATNSSVWRRSKLHVVEATVMYISNFTALCAGDFAGSLSSRRCVQLSCTSQFI